MRCFAVDSSQQCRKMTHAQCEGLLSAKGLPSCSDTHVKSIFFSQNRALNAISMASGRARPTVLSSYVIAYKDVIRLLSSHRPCLLPRTCTLQTLTFSA